MARDEPGATAKHVHAFPRMDAMMDVGEAA